MLKRAAAFALLAMSAGEELRLVTGWAYAGHAGAAAFAAYFVAALAGALPSQRLVIVAVTGAAVALAAWHSAFSALRSGVHSAVLFAAFLSTMQMLRVALETSPLLGEVRSHFARMTSGQQHDSALLRTHLVASVLGAGGLAALAAMVPPGTTDTRRCEFAQSGLQGIGLAALWSPFFVAMVVATRFVPGASLGRAVASGLGMALLGLLLSHALYGARRDAAPLLRSLRRTAVEVAVLAAGIIVANAVWGVTSLEAVVLGIPLVSAWVARRALRDRPGALAVRWFRSLESVAVEAVVVGAAMILGEVINVLLGQGLVAIPRGAEAWPIPVLIALPPLVMLATSRAGLHPIVSASCLLPALAAIDKLHGLAVTGSVLLGWMLCVLLSRFVAPVMFAAALFDVPQAKLVGGRNLRFSACFAALAVLYLWSLNALLGGP